MNTSYLNPPHKEYGHFTGRYVDAMPELLASGATPLSIADVMQKRLEVAAIKEKDLREHLMRGWFSWYHDTQDGSAHQEDTTKIVLAAPPLLTITPQSPLKEGALVITPDTYATLQGTELTRQQLEKAGINDYLSKSRVKKHPVWQALARNDQHLLNEYTDLIFSILEEKTAMGVYVTRIQGPALRAWFLDRVGDGRRSLVGGRSLLGYDGARLVGVREFHASGASAQISDPEKALALYKASVAAQVEIIFAGSPKNLSAELCRLESIVQAR